MDTSSIARGADQGERRAEARQDLRLDACWPGRSQVLRAGEVAFDGKVLPCALMETSRGGARVHLMDPAAVPEIAELRLRTGETWTVRRQWQQGAQVGFSVVGPVLPPTEPPAAVEPSGS